MLHCIVGVHVGSAATTISTAVVAGKWAGGCIMVGVLPEEFCTLSDASRVLPRVASSSLDREHMPRRTCVLRASIVCSADRCLT